MSTPQDFMERVVAWPGPDEPGYVNLHWKPPGNIKMLPGRPFKDLHDFMNFAQWGALRPSVMQDIYFCLSTQAMVGKQFKNHVGAARGIHFALKLKAIWLDVDVKPEKGYASVADALDAIHKFVHDAALPPCSALVLSGGGVHVYWISTVPLTRAEWQPFAEGLKSEAMRLGLRCDYGLTTDAARVLRVPGTYNRKTTPPRAVRLAGLGQSIDFELELGALKDIGNASAARVTATVTSKALVPFDLSAFAGQKPHPLLAHLNPTTDKLSVGINTHDDRPLDYTEVFKGCPHYMNSFKTHGAGQGQGLWMLTVLGTTFMEDGRKLAHTLSKGYPTYDMGETDAMFDRKLTEREDRNIGWPSCAAFESEGCKDCALCVYHNKIRSPLSLATRVPAAPAPSPSAAPPPPEMHMPPGYTVDPETGVIGAIIKQKVGASGESEDAFAPLFLCKITAPWTQAGPEGGPGALNFRCSLDMDRTGPVVIKDDEMATEQILVTALCRQRCKPVAANQKYVVDFMRAWTQLCDEAFNRQTTAPYGWIWEDGERIGFAYGGKVFGKDGSVSNAGHGDNVIKSSYMPVGKAQPYHDVMDVISSQMNPALEVIAASGYAAPLMYICGEDNTTLWAWSNEAGAHKTTAIRAAAAMWGHPKLAKITPKTSILSIQNLMGTLRSIPVYADEVGQKVQVEMIGQHINSVSEGSDDGKQTRTGKARERKEWQTMFTVGSNHSVREYLVRNNKTSDAQLQRVFEFEVFKQPDTHHGPDVRRMVESLDNNYGWMGLQYAEHVGKNFPSIKEMGKQIEADFMKEVGAKSENRFWTAACVAIITGAIQANAITPKPYFHIDMMWKFLKDTFAEQREYIFKNTTMGGTVLNTADFLSAFINAHPRNQLWTTALPGRFRPGFVDVIKAFTNPPEKVFMHWYRSDRLLRISKGQFMAFLEDATGTTSEPIMSGLAKHFNAEFPKSRVNLVAGVSNLSGAPESIIQIPVPPGSPLEEGLFTHSAMEDRPQSSPATDEITVMDVQPDLLAAGIAQAAADMALVTKH